MLQIQIATPADAEIIAKCTRDAYQKEIHDFDDPNKTNTYPPTEEVQTHISQHTYYKFVVDNEIIGGVFIVKKDEQTHSIENFCIAPTHHGKGYGTFILREIERLNPDVKIWVLNTPTYSVKNQYIYEKHGYQRLDMYQREDGMMLYNY